MAAPPFQLAYQLNDELEIQQTPGKPLPHLPGHPRILLSSTAKFRSFLLREFSLSDLEQMAPRLWMMSMQSHANISPLHRQTVKGRTIIITEDPRMHLIWYYDRIFLKPLPKYLLSHRFWTLYLLSSTSSPLGNTEERERIKKAALGYLRTWFYLIRHESDFRIATDERLQLVPKGVTWGQWCDFSSGFEDIQDHEVVRRYAYGEIRLSRLNFYSPFFLRKCSFQRIDAQYSTYFSRFYGPILFAFGIFSVLLSAMQVEMAVEQVHITHQWIPFWLACRWFSVICLLIVMGLSLWLAFLFAFKFVKEWKYALRDRWKKKQASTGVTS